MCDMQTVSEAQQQAISQLIPATQQPIVAAAAMADDNQPSPSNDVPTTAQPQEASLPKVHESPEAKEESPAAENAEEKPAEEMPVEEKPAEEANAEATEGKEEPATEAPVEPSAESSSAVATPRDEEMPEAKADSQDDGVTNDQALHSPSHQNEAAAEQKQPAPTTEPVKEMSLIEQHIMESVMVVVQKCRDGTLEIPDHYIRASTPPAVKPQPVHIQPPQQMRQQQVQRPQAVRLQQPQVQLQQRHQAPQAHQQQPQQHQQLLQQQPVQLTNQLLNTLYQANAQRQPQQQPSTTVPGGGTNPLDYLTPYLVQQTQQAAPQSNFNDLQRAMQAAVGGQYGQQTNTWPSGLYDALTAPYFAQQQPNQQQQVQQQQQQQQQQQNANPAAEFYGNYFGYQNQNPSF